jgi:hypothetical protein
VKNWAALREEPSLLINAKARRIWERRKGLAYSGSLYSRLLFLYSLGIRMKDKGEEGEKFRRVFALFL